MPNGRQVEIASIGGFDSEGMFCGPQELLWPTTVFRADQPIILAQGEVGPVPSYDECIQLRNKPKEEKSNKKKPNKKGKAGDDDDDEELDALLAELGVVENANATSSKSKKKAQTTEKSDQSKANKEVSEVLPPEGT